MAGGFNGGSGGASGQTGSLGKALGTGGGGSAYHGGVPLEQVEVAMVLLGKKGFLNITEGDKTMEARVEMSGNSNIDILYSGSGGGGGKRWRQQERREG